MRSEEEIREKLNELKNKSRHNIRNNTYIYGQFLVLRWVLGEELDHRIKITKKMENEMRKLRNIGTSVKEITKKFGVNPTSVTNHTNQKSKEGHNRRAREYQKRRRYKT